MQDKTVLTLPDCLCSELQDIAKDAILVASNFPVTPVGLKPCESKEEFEERVRHLHRMTRLKAKRAAERGTIGHFAY